MIFPTGVQAYPQLYLFCIHSVIIDGNEVGLPAAPSSSCNLYDDLLVVELLVEIPRRELEPQLELEDSDHDYFLVASAAQRSHT